ncbi:monovalent cation/H(+) antiporter subunit G [Ruixingdingia sedimenti]|uniref:Monovalent cation/H(+) antiporter subunit G n=1 Tax=Ruixingdingia sedimenti TaxID=3073604 RepID=A0ABU1F4A9_9RHOB|nr:monovalent cation/H(+) antiporter subunit G [Xinfangfangia sp. LG-4]MDR5651694.1 monovalent cation/H(+) antiporter subunit G [Xinfangfangia sp. LG-4]
MIDLETLPVWIALPAALFLVIGSTLTLLGTLGLMQLKSFYDRLHAPTLGTSWGTAGIMLASMLVFSWAGGRAVLHELVIAIFVMVTTPVTLMLLGRASLHRDRGEGRADVPPAPVLPPPPQPVPQEEPAE